MIQISGGVNDSMDLDQFVEVNIEDKVGVKNQNPIPIFFEPRVSGSSPKMRRVCQCPDPFVKLLHEG